MKEILIDDQDKISYIYQLVQNNLKESIYSPNKNKYYGYCNDKGFKVSPHFVGRSKMTRTRCSCACEIKGKSENNGLIIRIYRNVACNLSLFIFVFLSFMSINAYIESGKVLKFEIITGIVILVIEEIAYRSSTKEFLHLIENSPGNS